MSTMEALRTQLDNLQWELNRLDAENRRLREANDGAVVLVDLQAELEQSKQEVATLKEQLETSKREREAATALVETAETSSVESETKQLKDELEKTRSDLITTQGELSAEREKTQGLESARSALEEKTESLSVELREMRAKSDREREHEELNRYRAIGAEREKWEAREGRLTKELDSLREELTRCRGASSGDNTELREQLEVSERRLSETLEEVSTMQTEKEEVQQEMEVLRSEKESMTRELTAMRGENEMLCSELDQTKTELSVAREKVVQFETAIPRTTFPFSARTPVFNPVLFPTSTSSISTPFSFSSVPNTIPSSWSLPAPRFMPPMSVASGALFPATLSNAPMTTRTTTHVASPSFDHVTTPSGAPTTALPTTHVTAPSFAYVTIPSTIPVTTLPATTQITAPLSAQSTSLPGPLPPLPSVTNSVPSSTGSSTLSLLTGSTVPTSSVSGTTTTVVPPLAGSATSSSMVPTIPMTHLPQIPLFYGEQKDGETFQDWVEQFESVATLAGWNDHFKLVHLTSSLKGAAKSFYRSCAPLQRSNYQELVAALKKRFTPVQLTAVQTQLFHSRRQNHGESVDNFAQELRKLYAKAYGSATGANPQADQVGQIVLVNQFVAGLRPDIQMKVVGVEGGIDELVLKARFEEARIKEFSTVQRQSRNDRLPSRAQTRQETGHKAQGANGENREGQNLTGKFTRPNSKCYSCGSAGHFQKQCPWKKRAPSETPGHGRSRVANVVTGKNNTESEQNSIADLRRQLREAELKESLQSTSARMHGITTTISNLQLGPAPTAEVQVEGCRVAALLDTGSPVTIASLEFLLDVWAKQRTEDQTPDDWRKAVEQRLEEPKLTLQNYGGETLNIVCQVQVHLERAEHSVDAVVQVHKGAPTDLLLGTDLLAALGFQLLELQPGGEKVDLLSDDKYDGENGEPVNVKQGEGVKMESSDGCVISPVQVRMLQATRLPAYHRRLVKARAHGSQNLRVPLSLFLPDTEALREKGLKMEEAATTVPEDDCITLIVENQGLSPVNLEEGQLLGQLESVSLVEKGDLESSKQKERVSMISPVDTEDKSQPAARRERLLEVLQVEQGHLSPEEHQRLQSFIADRHELFALDPLELGSTDLVTHSVNTGDHPPIKQHPRRLPFALRPKVEMMVQKMLDQGVVTPSHSPWASPIVLVEKKDGTYRFCVDYRRLNSVTKLDVFPLPRIDDTLDLLAHSRYFSTLDLASGYWQVGMEPDSQEKTAFTTHAGLYEFRKMPFGLTNAPATFQRLMEVVLKGLTRTVCLDYIDDILVIGRTFEEHLSNLRQVFDRLREAGLKLKAEKCRFGAGEVVYLGYQVSQNGLAPTPDKIRAVEHYPTPRDLKTLRSFLGLASYYRRFVPRFSAIASPLHSLTRKDVPFVWTPECESTFCELKKLLCSAPVLVFPDFDRGFILETDASGVGLGSVLAQKQEDGTTRPVAYASRTLQAHERNYGVTELEALALVWSVKHFRHYLYGHHCDAYTDHEALKSLLQTPHPSGKLARWGLVLQELDLNIVYRSGKSNANADALSRAPVDDEDNVPVSKNVVVAALSSQQSSKSGEIPLKVRQRRDPELKAIIDYCLEGTLPSDDKKAREFILSSDQFDVIDDVLYHVEKDGSLRIVPPSCDRQTLFHEAHDGVFGAHLRDEKIHSELAKHYWWPQMRRDIARWCLGCLVCASRQVSRPTRPPLTPIPVTGPFDRVGVDVVKLPVSHAGNQYAIVFVDYLTKWPEVFPTKDQTSLTIAKLLITEIISRHGVPSELLSDRGTAFLSELMQNVCELMGSKKVNTTAYHPQTDGLVERFNRTLINMLSKKVERSGKDWDEHLPYVLFAYRASVQASTRESPFFLLYGRDPRLPTEVCLDVSPSRQEMELDSYKTEVATHMADAWRIARNNVKDAQRKQKRQYDKRTRPVKYAVGDRVFVLMPGARNTKAYKFARPFHGPYRVMVVHDTGLEVRPVDRPQSPLIRVAFDRVRPCSTEIGDVFWPPRSPRKRQESIESVEVTQNSVTKNKDTATDGPDATLTTSGRSNSELPASSDSERVTSRPNIWEGRLRTCRGRHVDKSGEM